MVKINYCPSCGVELNEKSFICPKCDLDIEELFAKGYLLASNSENNSIELFKGDEEIIVLNNEEDDSSHDDGIVIVVPRDSFSDELVLDLDKLGVDVENLENDVNIVVELQGVDFTDFDESSDDGEYVQKPNEWFFDDDPYGIVYYEFINGGD